MRVAGAGAVRRPRSAADIEAFLAGEPRLAAPLRALAALGLPDAWIGAGFVRNAVWDALSGLPFGHSPPGDIDAIWFGPSGAGREAEAGVQAALRAAMPGLPWSAREQSRMAARNGDAPYQGSLDAVAHWPETATTIAARWVGGRVELAAPWGTGDLLGLVLRPTPPCADNPAKRAAFAARLVGKRWQERWPRLRILDAAACAARPRVG